MGRGRSPHGGARPCLGAHRRVRLVAYRAAIRRLPVGVDGRGDRRARPRRPQGHPRHADGRPAEMAGRPLSRYPARRCARHYPQLRRPPALLLLQPPLPHRGRPHHRGHGAPLRREPLRARLADGQRIRRPRHDPQLFRRGEARLPRMARRPLRHGRKPESRLGHLVLEHALQQLRGGGSAEQPRRGADAHPSRRLLPLLLRSGEELQQGAGRSHPPPFARPAGHAQLHVPEHGFRPLQGRRGHRHRLLGRLPDGRPHQRAPQRGREGALSARRRSRPGRLQPRSLPRRRPRPGLGHGAAAGAGQLGRPQPVARRRHGAAVDVACLCPRRRHGLLFPLAAGAFRAGAVPCGPAAAERRGRPGLSGGRAGCRGNGASSGRRGAGKGSGRHPPRLRVALCHPRPAAGPRLCRLRHRTRLVLRHRPPRCGRRFHRPAFRSFRLSAGGRARPRHTRYGFPRPAEGVGRKSPVRPAQRQQDAGHAHSRRPAARPARRSYRLPRDARGIPAGVPQRARALRQCEPCGDRLARAHPHDGNGAGDLRGRAPARLACGDRQ